MDFRILSGITHIENIAVGNSIRDLKRLIRDYGKGDWKKQKGIAKIETNEKFVVYAELHWYEAHGVGKFEFKISDYLEDIEV
jgi:hypothetical protein